jgi:hypothetical protein
LRSEKVGACRPGRHQALEPLARARQLGRQTRPAGMDLGADVVGDQAHDPLAVGGRQRQAGIDQADIEAVDPDRPSG